MDEKQFLKELQNSELFLNEPGLTENSKEKDSEFANPVANPVLNEGESLSQDPSAELLLGKFKTVEDLSKAYEELQKYQGHCSEELGSLRKELASVKEYQHMMDLFSKMQTEYLDIVNRDREKYSGAEYFQDPTFREIYKEALLTFGADLDTDKLVNLLDSYAAARIFANDKKKAAQNETQEVLNSMTYDKNPKSSFTPPKKRFDEMTPKEIDELLDRLI